MKFRIISSGCIIAVAVCLAAPQAQAQATNEAQLWMETGLTYRPIRRLRLSGAQHFRFDQNLTRAQAIMTEVGLRYAPHRWLRFAIGYRIAGEADNDDEVRLRHRMHVDASTRHRFRPLILGFRLRFQEEARSEADDGEPWRHTLRFRTGLELRRVPLDPSLDVELFMRLSDGSLTDVIRKLRATLSITIPTTLGDLSVGYRLEGAFSDSLLRHIILFSWSYEIDD